MALWADFKKFAFKGNVVDLAVAVIIGGAFGKIVSALVADLLMPIASLALPGGDWRNAGWVLKAGATAKDDVVLKWGDFLGTILDFFVVAFGLFIVVSRIVKVAERHLVTPEKPADVKECSFCFETVPAKATRCKACTSMLDAPKGV